ncbi:MAG TPA: type II toxin-antitoxin system RelE/ParE family toxin [Armatimonadota bacterium]|nr:type II toxin-antitoxin system RelE/ParE family toxin [Armatimonadota bacterium]HQK92784.1 type II toxin-antitoxin system RelE/ParE family toxin [Armatimonadota bacterium]
MRERRYIVVPSRLAEKDLGRLSAPDADKAMRALLALEDEPLRGKPLKGALAPARRIDFGLSGGWYRAAYVLDAETDSIVVFMVGPRGGFYEEATRRRQALRRG